jgi:hypothetical protein
MQKQLSSALAEEINQSYIEATGHAENAKTYARSAVESAVRCGELLTEAKGAAKSSFVDWLAANCPDIGAEIAGRFMIGAKRVREKGIETFSGQQLLLFFAESEARPERPSVDRDPNGMNWLTEISRFAERFVKTLDHRPAAQWSEVERVTFLRQVEPIVKLARELGA